ncbi:MAG: 3'-5' exoribonuclease [Lachnospira sp.]|nr:3'-5' exoribonuclease [Lachnospira sp.]
MIKDYVALDVETTGLNPSEDRIIEIGMVKVIDGVIADEYTTLINPQAFISERITSLTGITQAMVSDKPVMSEVIGDIMTFIGELPILGHNVVFDYGFIKKAAINNGYQFEKKGIDTLKLARRLLPEVPHKTLAFLCEHFGIDAGNSHRALDDTYSAIRLFEKMYEIKPEDAGFNELMVLQCSVKKDSPITEAQRKYLLALIKKHSLALDVDVEGLTKSKASKIIDGIISEYGK